MSARVSFPDPSTPITIFPTVEFEAFTVGQLLQVLDWWVQSAVWYLNEHPETPHPYKSLARYRNEMRGKEQWQSVRSTLRLRWGDCEDLALYLAAWLRARKGIHATIALLRYERGRQVWYHAVVKLPDGRIVDPSKELGM